MRVNRINGVLLIDDLPRRGTKVPPPRKIIVQDALVAGESDTEIVDNFNYSHLFMDKDVRKKARILQKEGKVKLSFFSIEGLCGLTALPPGKAAL